MKEYVEVRDAIYQQNKVIALRFLKDTSLLQPWKEYVKTRHIENSWYKHTYPDNIFGSSSFTAFLARHYDFHIVSTITDMFSYYINILGIDCKLFGRPITKSQDLLINKETGEIKVIYHNRTPF